MWTRSSPRDWGPRVGRPPPLWPLLRPLRSYVPVAVPRSWRRGRGPGLGTRVVALYPRRHGLYQQRVETCLYHVCGQPEWGAAVCLCPRATLDSSEVSRRSDLPGPAGNAGLLSTAPTLQTGQAAQMLPSLQRPGRTSHEKASPGAENCYEQAMRWFTFAVCFAAAQPRQEQSQLIFL